MSKNKARSKALHQTFSEIIPEMDKALNKQLLEVLMKYTERDNELIVILNEDGPNIIELKSLKPVSLLVKSFLLIQAIIMWMLWSSWSRKLISKELISFLKLPQMYHFLKA
ncbi:hypothetical protein QYS46_00845 [Klebsiella michiganensis]|nr:hypothetical protein [Klebsiella michiganensis]